VTRDQRVPYMPATADELRFLIKKYWLERLDASKRENADDEEFLDLKVRATQRLMQDLIRSGLQPLEAESLAMREVALAD
jgi:ribosome assembly protein YihI (activator of Der GTPase)